MFRFGRRLQGTGDRAASAALHLGGTWPAAEERAAKTERLARLAADRGIAVPQEALQDAVDALRAELGLGSRRKTLAWLRARRLKPADLVAHCRAQLLQDLVLAATPPDTVRAWFDERRADYDAALLSVVACADEEQAWLVHAAARAAPDDFDDLAWSRPPLDTEIPAGGALGWRLRRDLPDDVAAALFETADGLPPPVLVGAAFHVYRVWHVRQAALTPAIEARCREDALAAALDGP